jgi:hypothetical protein
LFQVKHGGTPVRGCLINILRESLSNGCRPVRRGRVSAVPDQPEQRDNFSSPLLMLN